MNGPIRRIVVGIGLLDRHDPVLDVAVCLAQAAGAELHAVHVFDPPDPLTAAWTRLHGTDANTRREPEMARRLAQHVGAPTRASVRCHVLEGTPSERLAEIASEIGAELIVVGATRQDRVRRHFVGTTALGVISEARVPVLLIWQPVVRPIRRVLFTNNLSNVSTSACARGNRVLESLFAGDEPERRCLLVVAQSPGADDAFLDFARQEFSRAIEEAMPGQPLDHAVRQGDPAVAIIREANEWRADIVVIGNHGYAGRSRGVGSVAGMVLREAARNTLVIPSGAPGPA
jgi:nucleotide-binding universal stress UspA family protein